MASMQTIMLLGSVWSRNKVCGLFQMLGRYLLILPIPSVALLLVEACMANIPRSLVLSIGDVKLDWPCLPCHRN